MPRDQSVRWESSETIEVLNFLNNNFDSWHKNHLSACIESIEATSITRDAKSIYNKVHSMIKAMENFLCTGKKSVNCAIIWEDKTIHDLVRQLYRKTKERRAKENLEIMSDNDKTSIDTDQITTETSTTLFSNELVNNLYEKKIKQIDQIRSKLIETITIANSTLEKSNIPISYSLDTIENSCREKTKKISELQSELIKTIETANDLYEKLKNFNWLGFFFFEI